MECKTFVFNGIEYSLNEIVRVSGHYAGYKSQHPFMIGMLYTKMGCPFVRLLISPYDIEQIADINLNCFGKIEKISL